MFRKKHFKLFKFCQKEYLYTQLTRLLEVRNVNYIILSLLKVLIMLSFYFQGEKRVQSPTALENPSYTSQTSLRRNTETFAQASQIHGATMSNKRLALDGLFDSLQKRFKTSELGNYVLSNTKVSNYITEKKQKVFQNSRDNILRSIATYHTGGVMSKCKYQAVRVASTMKSS